MKKILTLKDGRKYNLPLISYEEFIQYPFANGGSDYEWEYYLRQHNCKEIQYLNLETQEFIGCRIDIVDNNGNSLTDLSYKDSDDMTEEEFDTVFKNYCYEL